jgi:HAMP domain-containing protein
MAGILSGHFFTLRAKLWGVAVLIPRRRLRDRVHAGKASGITR